jgi:GNAT superfamily N-acetyltransferase
VRAATQDDLDEIVRVINAAYRVEDFFVKGNRTSVEEMRRRMTSPGSTVLVIDAESGLAAAVLVEVQEERGHFAMLSVDPPHQGRGLARILMGAIADHCRGAGCVGLDLEVVNLREELPSFYDAFGFRPAGTAPFNAPEKLTREAHLVRMSKPL